MTETNTTITNVLEFEQYKVVNAHIRFMDAQGVLGEAKALGCIGTLTTEPETKSIQKICAGEVTKEVTKTTKLNCSLSAHIIPAVAMEVFGLTNENLKAGVFGYNGKSTARGVITMEILDMFEEQRMLIAFPVSSFSSGLTLNIESGQEEIAMIELPFSALRDQNGYFYYQAYDVDVTDQTVLDGWNTNFEETLVKLDIVVGE